MLAAVTSAITDVITCFVGWHRNYCTYIRDWRPCPSPPAFCDRDSY